MRRGDAFDVAGDSVPAGVAAGCVVERLDCTTAALCCAGAAGRGPIPAPTGRKVAGNPLSRFVDARLPSRDSGRVGVDEEKLGLDKVLVTCAGMVDGLHAKLPVLVVRANDDAASVACGCRHSARQTGRSVELGCNEAKSVEKGADAATASSSDVVVIPYVPQLRQCLLPQTVFGRGAIVTVPLRMDVELALLLHDLCQNLVGGKSDGGLDFALAAFIDLA